MSRHQVIISFRLISCFFARMLAIVCFLAFLVCLCSFVVEFWPGIRLLKAFVSGSRHPCRGNPFYKLLVASQCSRRSFLGAKKSVPGILEPPIVENASCCVRKQAPLPGESISQAFSGLSVLPQGLFLPKSAFQVVSSPTSCKIVNKCPTDEPASG